MSEHRARKRFGQHFLHDPTVLAHIDQAVAPRTGDHLLEIGPGQGALTELLLAHGLPLDAIEIDRDLAQALRQRWGERLTLHEGDALDFDYGALARQRGGRLRVIGNLPYNISTPLIFRLLEFLPYVQDMHIMLQKEVIDRMAAPPGSDDYGRLSVMLAPYVQVEKLFDVGPGAFRPPPRVWSAVARVDVLPEPRFVVPPAYGALVSAAFSARRKTLRNALRQLLPESAFAACGVDPGLRPEVISPAQFAALAALAPAAAAVVPSGDHAADPDP
jgi:16S rRNA (adenine1518-N6/adenine1519-N6)-dimethyltransferase